LKREFTRGRTYDEVIDDLYADPISKSVIDEGLPTTPLIWPVRIDPLSDLVMGFEDTLSQLR